MIPMQKLLFWLEKRYNVLLEGKHGVGKTAVVIEAFEQAGLNYAYFSGSTMDPYIDFVGVPIKIDTADGSYIELIRPKHLAQVDKPIQAIFLDEFNRTHKKIRNAVMELIQFKTINGVPLSSDLRVVWAAVNPDNEDGDGVYDTDRLDPAQRDRFQVQQTLPYACDESYFIRKYGEQTGKSAVQFWNELPEVEKNKISPRRLDYALQCYKDAGDIQDILPLTSNPTRLKSILQVGPADSKLRSFLDKPEEARRFLQNENNYSYAIQTILGNIAYMKFFLPLLSLEKIALLYTDNKEVRKIILKNIAQEKKASPFVQPLMEIATANQNMQLASQIREELDKVGISAAPAQVPVFFRAGLDTKKNPVIHRLTSLAAESFVQTYHRKKGYNTLISFVAEHMSKDEAKLVLQIADKLCNSYTTTIKRDMPNMVKIANHALLTLLHHGATAHELEAFMKTVRRLRRYLHGQAAPSIRDLERYAKAKAAPQVLAAEVEVAMPGAQASVKITNGIVSSIACSKTLPHGWTVSQTI